MERPSLHEHLALAETHVAEGEQIIARQRRLLAELQRDGHDTRMARELLHTFEKTQAWHVADRDRLRAELSDSGAAD